MKGTGVNAERGMAHGSSTFEERRTLGSSVDGIGETLRATWRKAALGGVADQGEGAALAPRGTACSETPSSGEVFPEDPVTGFVSNRAVRTQLKCLPARGCGTR